MNMVDVRVIFYINLIYIVIFGCIFLKELIIKFDIVVILFSLIGVVLIVRSIFLFGFLGGSVGSEYVWFLVFMVVFFVVFSVLFLILVRKLV